jgi:hypothetical protein
MGFDKVAAILLLESLVILESLPVLTAAPGIPLTCYILLMFDPLLMEVDSLLTFPMLMVRLFVQPRGCC